MEYQGYTGRILYVNLSTGKLEPREYDPSLAEEYLGGVGLGTRLLWDDVGPDVAPRDPDNLLVFATGPLCGTLIPNAGRLETVAKSPLTGFYGCSSAGGFLGRELKYAGWDAIVVTGQASQPVYLAIIKDELVLRDASELWGLTTSQTEAAIRQAWGDPEIRTATIGPAGESGTRLASIRVPSQRASDRCGIGTVMGSKQLKAVVVRGDQPVRVADPARLYHIAERILRRVQGPDRPVAGTTLHRVEYEAIRALGDDTWDTDLNAVLGVKRLCEDLGLDTISTSRAIGYAMDLWQRGILSTEDTGGLALERGSVDTVLRLVNMIAHRQGYDGWLLRSAHRAGGAIGGDDAARAMQIAGVETGAQVDPDQMGDAAADLRPDQVKDREDLAAVLDSVGICRSSGIFVMDDIKWLDIAEAMEAATGMEMPVERLKLLGERIFNLQRCYNASHGVTESDDWLHHLLGAKLLHSEAPQGEDAGLDPSLEEYYRLRGWNPKTGWACQDRLRELGLELI